MQPANFPDLIPIHRVLVDWIVFLLLSNTVRVEWTGFNHRFPETLACDVICTLTSLILGIGCLKVIVGLFITEIKLIKRILINK